MSVSGDRVKQREFISCSDARARGLLAAGGLASNEPRAWEDD